MSSTNRVEQWAGLDHERHLRLIDGDLDRNEDQHRDMQDLIRAVETRLKSEMRAGFKTCDDNADQSRKYLIGILCSLVVAALMLAANILILGGGQS